MIVFKIIRLPLKLLALPVALILLACHLVLNLIIGLSSFATLMYNLICGFCSSDQRFAHHG